ncbi:hypothetical protein FACS1894179_03600 [Bacteroidia bacterium]|nr:hypothetical protein FACS1894169_15200 [Bacteroidia bacterium]GHV39147.1 hypothetical protein FACS1894179_03600 [Bacteroidia bacterium]
MEQLIYLTVKGACAAYILYKAYRFLSGKRAAGFWQYIIPEAKEREKQAAPQMKAEPEAYSVVGKSQTVYLEEPPKAEVKAVEPAFSEDLPQAPAYEEEPDIRTGDVDDSLNDNPDEEILSREERFIPLDTEPDGGMVSTGMTFGQISQALDVVQGRQTDDAGKAAAARILYEIEGSDVFNFLAAQAENEAVIEKLLKESLDGGGVSFPEKPVSAW